jgi:3-oxoacyl-[acyl-carrier protein] reductase
MSTVPSSTKPLAGKVALITGGSRGIGAAIARRLADDGANVAISYATSTEKAEAVVQELKARPPTSTARSLPNCGPFNSEAG